MSNDNKMKKLILRLVESGMLIALATILSMIKPYQAPYGGSVTIVSMLPLVVLSYRYGVKWGAFACFSYGLLQLIIDGLPPAGAMHAVIISIILDYFAAFPLISLSGIFRNKIKNHVLAISLGTVLGLFGRFAAHFVSGITVWASNTPEGTPVWLYSLLYNGFYMGIEIITTTTALIILGLIPHFANKYLFAKV